MDLLLPANKNLKSIKSNSAEQSCQIRRNTRQKYTATSDEDRRYFAATRRPLTLIDALPALKRAELHGCRVVITRVLSLIASPSYEAKQFCNLTY
jgi:hypothetical protein